MPEAGASCSPGDVLTFQPVPIAPQKKAACTDAQISSLVSSCFSKDTSSKPACDAWAQDAKNANDCYLGCIVNAFSPTVGGAAKGPWGPIVAILNPGESNWFNIGGCVSVTDQANMACGDQITAAFECGYAACEANCPVPKGGSDPASVTSATSALFACFMAANKGGCKMFDEAASSCAQSLGDAGAGSFCFDVGSSDHAVADAATIKFFGAFCGGVIADAGGGG